MTLIRGQRLKLLTFWDEYVKSCMYQDALCGTVCKMENLELEYSTRRNWLWQIKCI